MSNSFGTPGFDTSNRWTLLVNDLCRQAIQDKKMQLNTNGLQQRDFITLEDVGLATCHLAQLPRLLLENGIFNLGGNNTMTVKAMALLVQEIASEITGQHIPLTIPDFTAIDFQENNLLDFQVQKLLNTGYKLKGNIKSEIEATLRYCIKHG